VSEEREASPRSEPPPGEGFRAGAVALVGRPNAGKSTLMNHLLAEKVAIVSDKPQTTRSQLVGILTEGRGQIVFYDTPGIHKPLHQLNRQMVREALSALEAVDVICLLVDASARATPTSWSSSGSAARRGWSCSTSSTWCARRASCPSWRGTAKVGSSRRSSR
jgi:tRNA U34 5-carboxymethylaminomethyl modifying GTPase MnmE/TrmE